MIGIPAQMLTNRFNGAHLLASATGQNFSYNVMPLHRAAESRCLFTDAKHNLSKSALSLYVKEKCLKLFLPKGTGESSVQITYLDEADRLKGGQKKAIALFGYSFSNAQLLPF